jgi:hypothetical protein
MEQELKLIFEFISKLTDGGVTAFIAYLVIKYGIYYLFNLLGVAFVAFIFYLTAKGIYSTFGFHQEIKGVMGFYGELADHEKIEILKALRDYKDKKSKDREEV